MNSNQKAHTSALVVRDDEASDLMPITSGRDLINVSGDTVTTCTAHLDEDERSLIRWAYDYARDQEWGWNAAARELGVSTTTLYRMWSDKYRYPMTEKVDGKEQPHPRAGERISLASVCEKIATRKRLIEERSTLRTIQFVSTTVYRRITRICKEALLSQTIALIFGESQIGKTESLQEHRRNNNHGQTVYVRMPASAGVQLMMKEIARACRVSPDSSFENLRTRVFKALDKSKLLLVDEVHQTFTTYQKRSMLKCLEVLREIHDASKCGMVLCGTNVLREQFESGEFAQLLKQLRRRGVLELQLPPVAPLEDLNAIANAYGLPPLKTAVEDKKVVAKDEVAALVLAIAEEYGLGRYIKFLAMGSRHASKKQQRYGWQHFMHSYDIMARLKDNKPNAS
jgi:DNA transposition AAA+ family ATPase